ncbi:SDR family oxidoreductase [Staphylococcus simiae]|uniref:SDR family oxidoreductase n=1 Tax=Staphylococcus simiae TaxID=308354 RepID=UPI001A965CBA|nr:SDR family oxidoreductase [Staphylococcus simiae]MBO1199897.1 SDR family oxidoreductase [Staphylococcus simiae]MBO1202158.1 SDR family oxidoreductase [Staphylococcus simiae]MBO1204416.1 SDR family oxidoreductase [Staphylococcus simiae]MBO1211956.1 SDR family oxidoreductase [Staphylococcus simiae]MBO1230601.1 SDR family oxidoreductase [Staphylococcus simiae]
MNIFVTGATGFIGTAVIKELIANGHQVTGLARTLQSADKLRRLDALAHHGDLENYEVLKEAVKQNDAVIHLAYVHDFSSPQKFFESGTIDMKAILAMGEALQGTNKPLIVTGGIAGLDQGHLLTETFRQNEETLEQSPRRSELAAQKLTEQGINVSIVRLPPAVYGNGTSAFVDMLSNIALQTNVSGYLNNGQNKWSAVHYEDAAQLFRLVVEQQQPGIYHAVKDEGIALKEIAQIIGDKLNLPVSQIADNEAVEHFGPTIQMVSLDCPASCQLTQQQTGWLPNKPSLIEELLSSK